MLGHLAGNQHATIFIGTIQTPFSNSHISFRTSRPLNMKAVFSFEIVVNPLTPNDLYISRTTPQTSKRCILYIYSTNVGSECFKHALYSPFFLFKMQFVS
jgi:hypothetical protein